MDLQKYLNRDLKAAIAKVEVIQGTAKDSGNVYYAVEITFINGYSQRIFLRGAEQFAWTSAFDLLQTQQQIDNAFSNGEITKQEYDDLNLGLANYTEAICVKAERSTAMWEVVKQNVQALSAKFMGGVSSNETDSEKISETLHNRITEFVEEYCSINRSLLNTLIARVRSGENLLPEGTVQTYNRENTAGYFKNNYKPFVPVKLI